MDNGQKKRIQTLIDKGFYHKPNFVKRVCKYCGKTYEYDCDNKRNTQYVSYGYCSDKCYSDSGEKIISKMRTTLINGNIPFNEDNIKEMYSIYMSKQSKSCADKWRSTMEKKYGFDYASKRSSEGWKNYKKRFLINNNIIKEEEYNNLTEEEADKIFIDNFNSVSKHGEHVKKGRKSKYGADYKKSYQNGLIKAIHNLMEKKYGKEYIEKLSEEEFQKLYDECSNIINSKKKVKDTLLWKKRTLKNHGHSSEYLENCSKSEIEKLYSEYLSKRMKTLVPTLKNGYKHTEKGWFSFKKWEKFFFRSSWEKHVCETLEENSDIIDDVKVPEPIYYELSGQTHAYFCDFEVVFKNGSELYIEVKPFRKISEVVNECKIKSAKEKYGDSFMVASEYEIFSNQLSNILKDYGKNKVN